MVVGAKILLKQTSQQAILVSLFTKKVYNLYISIPLGEWREFERQ